MGRSPSLKTGAARRPARWTVDRQAEQGRREHDRRKWHAQEVDADERGQGDGCVRGSAQRPSADLEDRGQDDRHDDGLEASEKPRDSRDRSEGGIDVGQAKQDENGGEHEQNPRGQSARRSVEQPADVDGELLRLGTRKQHAEVQGVKELLLGDPSALLDEIAMHHRDLTRRAPEVHEAKESPIAQGLGTRRPLPGHFRLRREAGAPP